MTAEEKTQESKPGGFLSPTALWEILKEALIEWDRDNVSRLAAALAYYAVFSLAPLLVIAVGLAGLLFGEEAARGQIVTQFREVFGAQGAQIVQTMVERAGQPGAGILATMVGLTTLVIGATGAFNQLQSGLNTVWEVAPKPRGILKGLLWTRLVSFAMVLCIGFLLLVSLVVSAALEAFNEYMAASLPAPPLVGWEFLNWAVSFLMITILFAMTYKILPDVEIPWRDVWLGAGVTSLLFTLGKYLIGLYLGNSSIGSTYGAAGTLAVLLIWIYYSAQIFYIGAEITQVYASRYGYPIRPAPYATRFVKVPVMVEESEKANVRRFARDKIRAILTGRSVGEAAEPDAGKVEVVPGKREAEEDGSEGAGDGKGEAVDGEPAVESERAQDPAT